MGSWAHNALIIGELFFGDYFFCKVYRNYVSSSDGRVLLALL